MTDATASVELRAILKDEISQALIVCGTSVENFRQKTETLSKSVETTEGNMRGQARAIEETTRRWREQAQVLTEEQRAYQGLEKSLSSSIVGLEAQLKALKDPGFAAALRERQALKVEIDNLTKSVLGGVEATSGAVVAVEKETVGILSNTRARREAIVLMHELAMGRYKQLAGSAMVFGEYTDAEWMHKLAAGVTPLNIGFAAAGVVIAGFAVKMWEAAEASAEMVHKAELLGKVEGVSAQSMLGLQYMAEGTGTSIDVLARAFGRFTEKLGSHSADLQKIGVTSRVPIEAFGQLADIIKTTTDVTERDRIAKEALGVGWQKLIPILEQGKEGMQAAMSAMNIPEATFSAYERANKAQVQIDKAWMAIKMSSGGYFAELRASLKETEAGLLGHSEKLELINKQSRERYELAKKEAALHGGPALTASQASVIAGAAAASRFSKGGQAESVGLTEDQQEIAKKSLGVLSKKDLAIALAEEADAFEKSRAVIMGDFSKKEDLNKAHQKALEDLEKAHLQTMADIRASFVKKTPAAARIDSNVLRTGPNEVTMRGAMSWSADGQHIEGGDAGEQAKGVERLEQGRRKSEQKAADDAKKLHDEVQKISAKRLEATQKLEANAQKIRMDWESALIEKKRQAHDEEMKLIRERFDVGQKLASDQVYKMLQGEFTLRGAYEATKDVLFRAFADTTTKWIEEQLLKLVFAKTTQAEETAASVAQASIVGAAWAGPSMAVSIATMGTAPATGSAAWFTSMTAAQGYSMMPHARGGAVFGPYMGSREERLESFVPSRVVPAYNSQTTNHNTTNAQSITIHVHGGDERTILRTLRKAGINGAGVSRS